jgi:hypothetical protein
LPFQSHTVGLSIFGMRTFAKTIAMLYDTRANTTVLVRRRVEAISGTRLKQTGPTVSS